MSPAGQGAPAQPREPQGMTQVASPVKNTAARRLSILMGYGIAGFCLAWVLYHVHPGQLWRHTLQLDWYLVVLAIAVHALNYVLQGLRARLILKPLVPARDARWSHYTASRDSAGECGRCSCLPSLFRKYCAHCRSTTSDACPDE